MNLLYISSLDGQKWQGPSQSVPNQISAQSQYDNVFWYDINPYIKSEWNTDFQCHNLSEYPNMRINDLPSPFNNPDLVIFEGVYEYPFCRIVFELWKRHIPYIVIPRSSLTRQAQRRKVLKKKIANYIYFNLFVNKARAIQYLTNNEYSESSEKWNRTPLIIPNGININNKKKIFNRLNQISGIYIGRIDTYQKGLDLLFEACIRHKKELRYSNCVINVYGPDRYNSKAGLAQMIHDNNVQDIIRLNDGVYDYQKENRLLDADFFIMTSRFEGHPMGLIEALSYGLPCLVTVGTNMATEIAAADAGWTAENNVVSIQNALVKMMNEKEKFEKKGNAAFILAQEFDWRKIAERSHEEYLRILARNRP